MSTIYVSREGLELLNGRLKKANEELEAIRAEKGVAYNQTGDTWHDNPYFSKLEQNERRKVDEVREIEFLISGAQVVSLERRDVSRVQLGSIIHLSCYAKVSGEKEEFVWEVAGYGETDAARHRVAYNAPLMQVIIGLRVGDITNFNSPKGPVEYRVLGLFSNWEEVPDKFKSD